MQLITSEDYSVFLHCESFIYYNILCDITAIFGKFPSNLNILSIFHMYPISLTDLDKFPTSYFPD
jgi:hypothetical protein